MCCVESTAKTLKEDQGFLFDFGGIIIRPATQIAARQIIMIFLIAVQMIHLRIQVHRIMRRKLSAALIVIHS